MKISAKEEYGLRCLLQLAREREGRPLTVAQIADREGLTSEYVAKILHTLRKAGLITSIRGVHGGFVLSKPAGEVSLWTVLERISGGVFDETFCGHHAGVKTQCVHIGDCSIRPLWSMVGGYLHEALAGVTLSDLMEGERTTLRNMGKKSANGRTGVRMEILTAAGNGKEGR